MDRGIMVGLIIALVLTAAGAFLISANNGDGGFLLDFLQNSNTSTGDNNSTNNSYINNTNSTINQTTNDTQLNNTNSTISFITAAVFDNSTNNSIISIDTSNNITVDSIVLFTSYNNTNFTEASSLANVSLPTTITVPVNMSYSELYYYLELLYNNTTYRVPENGSEFINISA